ncbi:MAG: helix-turn-helix transcriptional regulator [Bradyrhizobium sp.]|uniref:helix-turn-helix transcriptional regulator n=1 Tax=Bradyrhizobium sp. TaxID=376 RepID=UPI0025B9B21F|nr:helix-turn-helix transcriptional regulator [Bradyrhizobium sp.]MBI5265557.1 helix-turn-helix transcriptional regulator [Bradyrhizobium sp.]
MGHRDQSAVDSRAPRAGESAAPRDESEVARLEALRARVAEETSAAIARQLNGPLTALLLYMGEIKNHSDRLLAATGDKAYLQDVVDNALAQTERVCALVKQIVGAHKHGNTADETKAGAASSRAAGSVVSSAPGHRPLTKREREVLRLISEGYSNKQGALRMRISPRTFESHRAEAMRKLGARNTADLVRAALLHPID